MEFYDAALIGALMAFVGLFLGRHMAPKSKAAREMQTFYETAIDTLKKDVKSLRARASYYQKGAIPSELASGTSDNPEALLDAILMAMPANWRPIIQSFKPQIVAEMKKDPASTQAVIDAIKAKVGASAEQKQEGSPDAI